jgi:hypothetical protein
MTNGRNNNQHPPQDFRSHLCIACHAVMVILPQLSTTGHIIAMILMIMLGLATLGQQMKTGFG